MPNYDDFDEIAPTYGLGGSSPTPDDIDFFRKCRIDRGWAPDNPTEDERVLIEKRKNGEFNQAIAGKLKEIYEGYLSDGWVPGPEDDKEYVEMIIGRPLNIAVEGQ